MNFDREKRLVTARQVLCGILKHRSRLPYSHHLQASYAQVTSLPAVVSSFAIPPPPSEKVLLVRPQEFNAGSSTTPNKITSFLLSKKSLPFRISRIININNGGFAMFLTTDGDINKLSQELSNDADFASFSIFKPTLLKCKSLAGRVPSGLVVAADLGSDTFLIQDPYINYNKPLNPPRGSTQFFSLDNRCVTICFFNKNNLHICNILELDPTFGAHCGTGNPDNTFISNNIYYLIYKCEVLGQESLSDPWFIGVRLRGDLPVSDFYLKTKYESQKFLNLFKVHYDEMNNGADIDQLEEFIVAFGKDINSNAIEIPLPDSPNVTPKQKIEKLLCTLFPSSPPFAINFNDSLPPEDIIPEEVEIGFRNLKAGKALGSIL
ncbi:hypothetical protein TNCV_4350091 [Trichonephila clavipes]|nr:hypothetical protein TNCV_4350091 [Trichonephila clavipes]